MSKRNINGSRAIITGASSGIGYELALHMAKVGSQLVIVARRETRLLELAKKIAESGGQVETVVGDITDPNVRTACIEKAQSCFGGLDILINNAGIGAMGKFENADPERARQVMEINFFALIELTRLALPLLKNGVNPIIVNISSILGRRGVPYNSEYSASKFAVHGFSESLRAELTADKIDVLVVSPGTTSTEFFDSVIQKTGEPSWPEHAPVTAAHVAKQTIKAIERGRHEIVPYKWGKLLCWLNRLSPRLVDSIMARYA